MVQLFANNVHSFFRLLSLVGVIDLIYVVSYFDMLSGDLINPNLSTLLDRTDQCVTSITSAATLSDDKVKDDSLRLCLTCREFLQRRYDEICFENIAKHQIVQHYAVKAVDTYICHRHYSMFLS
jgi:hypothetical protein